LRKERGLTLKELAARSGLSISYISDLEHGRASPSLATLRELAAALGLSPADLLEGWEEGGEPVSPLRYLSVSPNAAPGKAGEEGRESEGGERRESRGPEMGGKRAFPSEVGPWPPWGVYFSKAVRDIMPLRRVRSSWVSPAVRELLSDPAVAPLLTEEWVMLLTSLSRHALAISGKPLTRDDLLELFLHLRRVIEKG
jgi:transcriptional regulator with XRE-family HTH domain